MITACIVTAIIWKLERKFLSLWACSYWGTRTCVLNNGDNFIHPPIAIDNIMVFESKNHHIAINPDLPTSEWGDCARFCNEAIFGSKITFNLSSWNRGEKLSCISHTMGKFWWGICRSLMKTGWGLASLTMGLTMFTVLTVADTRITLRFPNTNIIGTMNSWQLKLS